MRTFDVVILGAGAAGLMCAIEAGKRGRRTLVLDHADSAGKKILISGGGRSNFTNLHTAAENFLSENLHFARSALARYTPQDFISLVERHGISYHEKTLGQLFCDRSSRDLLNLLLKECDEARVSIELATRILSVKDGVVKDGAGDFVVETSLGSIRTRSLVVATGGLSIPQMGATGLGYDLARQYGLRVVEPRPALVPFTFSAEDRERWCDLSGVSAEAVATTTEASPRRRGGRAAGFREKLLITHRGLSGPAALQISSYWRAGQAVSFDLAPELRVFDGLMGAGARRDQSAALVGVRHVLPARWAERWIRLHGADAGREISNEGIAFLEEQIHSWSVIPAGTEGFAKAEVTAGGVATEELDARSFAAKRRAGLYFVGEVIDVTGWLGGYNFQWAWASGFGAGQVV